MTNKINFTKASISSLPLPQQGKINYFYDSQIKGLGIMTFASGTKTFFLYKRINGKPDKIKIGRFPDLTVEQSRKMAYSLINKISLGQNPKKIGSQVKQDISLQTLLGHFIEKHGRLYKKTWKQDQEIFNRYISNLSNKKIEDINKETILKLHTHISKEHGFYPANHTLALLKTMFNKANEWGYCNHNPCIGVKKFKEKSRERFLQADELPRFFKALNNEPNELFRDYFYITLLTGARRRTVGSMNWKDINFTNQTWKIEENKNGESQSVHLSEQAINILQHRFNTKSSEWVFPSPTSASGHIEEPKKIWKRILINANIKDLRIHDLRRTLGSWQAATGANSYIIGKSLGHKTQQATAIYARLDIDPVRESVNKATEAMFATVNKLT